MLAFLKSRVSPAGVRHADLDLMCALQKFDDEALAFQERIIERAGLGDETYLPMGAHPLL
jgi:Fe-S-cluster formation regulator IscX/YfhJ